MVQQLSSELVWKELSKELFAVLGFATAKREARTAGVVYIVHDRKLYVVSNTDTWKVRHIKSNPYVSITVPIAKRIPFLPWIKIPAATITFHGQGLVLDPQNVKNEILHALTRGMEEDLEQLGEMSVIEITPMGDFITYGVGVPLMAMQQPEKARGRAPAA